MKWEYKTTGIDEREGTLHTQLNKQGKLGWELVQLIKNYEDFDRTREDKPFYRIFQAVFKRPKIRGTK